MAIKLLTSIQRYIGLSTDIKPTDCANGSTFLEKDTGNLCVFKDGAWTLKSEANIAVRLEIKHLLTDLLEEAKKTNEHLALMVGAM